MSNTYKPPNGSFVIRLDDTGEVELIPFVGEVDNDPHWGHIARTLVGDCEINAWWASEKYLARTRDGDCLHALLIPNTEGPPPGATNAAYFGGYAIFDGAHYFHSPSDVLDAATAKASLHRWAQDTINNWRERNSLSPTVARFPGWFTEEKQPAAAKTA